MLRMIRVIRALGGMSRPQSGRSLSRRWMCRRDFRVEAVEARVLLTASSVDVTTLDGTNGVHVDPSSEFDLLTSAEGVGDFNGDGLDDLLVKDRYLILGRADGLDHTASFIEDLTDAQLQGERIQGAAGVGNFNGDGFDDLAFLDSSRGYDDRSINVVFGNADPPESIDIDDLDAASGLMLSNQLQIDVPGPLRFGYHLERAGDIDGDGFDDIAVNVEGLESRFDVPVVLFGGPDRREALIVADGDVNEHESVRGGTSGGLSSGDINGDGLDDLLVNSSVVESGFYDFLVFATGRDDGDIETEQSPLLYSVHAHVVGDFNGDGFDDFAVSRVPHYDAASYDSRDPTVDYVVFGGPDGAPLINDDTRTGDNAFEITTTIDFAFRGQTTIRAIGDVNGDGLDDLAVDNHRVLFGGTIDAGESIDVAEVGDGTNGFQITGHSRGELVGAGDLNGDGADDLAIAAWEQGLYVIYGVVAPVPEPSATILQISSDDITRDGDTITLRNPNQVDSSIIVSEQDGQLRVDITSSQSSDPDTSLHDLTGIERLRLELGEGNRHVDASQSPVPVEVSTAGGDDTIIGSMFDDTLHGGSGPDVINGRGGRDRIFGDDGVDVLFGGGGNDHIDGGDGSDRLSGNKGHDVLIGGNGNDRLDGDNGNDRLAGGAGADSLSGGDDNDTLFGEGGMDTLAGGAGTDQLTDNTAVIDETFGSGF